MAGRSPQTQADVPARTNQGGGASALPPAVARNVAALNVGLGYLTMRYDRCWASLAIVMRDTRSGPNSWNIGCRPPQHTTIEPSVWTRTLPSPLLGLPCGSRISHSMVAVFDVVSIS